jgi:hypothetical protein
MPAKRSRLKCRHVFTLLVVVFLVPAGAEAQTGGVTMKTTVSETVALSVLANSTQTDVNTNVSSSGNTVRITLWAADTKARVIRVPLLVRSNSSFMISAAVESNTAEVSQLLVVDAEATGTLVSPQAINDLKVPRQFDVRGLDDITPPGTNPLDLSRPVLVASGPRVSRGGTLISPNNALQITLLIRLQPQQARDWLVHLTFVATAGSLTQ